MIEETLDIATKDGAMETFVCRPERGAHPAVLFLMDAPGIREELRDMTRRLATRRLLRAAAEPLLPRRSRHDVRTRRARARQPRAPAHARGADQDDDPAGDGRRRGHDRRSSTASEGVKRGPIGVHGYCMSGPYALAAAARYPDRVAAAASFYGTWLVSDAVESPHLTLGKIKGEALHRLRRARRAGAAADGRGAARAVREGRQSGRARDLSRRAPRLRASRAARSTTSRRPSGTGSG